MENSWWIGSERLYLLEENGHHSISLPSSTALSKRSPLCEKLGLSVHEVWTESAKPLLNFMI